MSEADPRQQAGGSAGSEMARALRPLAWFWGSLLLLLVLGAVTLQVLGPPPARMAAANPAPPPPAATPLPPLAVAATPPAVAMAPRTPPLPAIPGVKPVAPPQTDLQEGEAVDPATMLPRIGPDGRTPMQAYAAYAEPADQRPRIAILVAGLGMSASESEDAIQNLPAAVSLAFSPYAYKPEPLLDEARAHGHEYLVSIPMEPQGYPLDDPGNRALMTGNTDAENLRLLDWALSRFAGYVGATGALGSLRGERFGDSITQMAPVLSELATRGLLYIDPRPGAPRPPGIVGRSIDVVLDAPAVRTEIEAKLAELEQVARDRGSAIGLAGQPLPVTVDRIAAWTNTLAAHGFALVPVSALASVVPPPMRASALSLSGSGTP